MRLATYLGLAGCVVMAVAIAYALIVGSFFEEAMQMMPLPWFHLSMIDLYAGFLIVGGWVVFREQSRAVALIWLVLILTLGNLASFLYIVLAARRASDWSEFWLGFKTDNTSRGKNRSKPDG